MEIWDDNLDFDDDLTDEEWDILFEEAEMFEIETIEYPKHTIEIHSYSKIGELPYPFEFETNLESDIILN